MRKDDVHNALERTLGFWREFVAPLSGELFTGEIMTVEGQVDNGAAEKINAVAMWLDMYAGIDSFVLDDGILRGVAMRFQSSGQFNRDGMPWNTFTVRSSRISNAETELAKRQKAITDNGLFPFYTFQAYVVPTTKTARGRLLSCALCKTRDLFACIDDPRCPSTERTNADESGISTFRAVKWDDMIACKYWIRTLDETGHVIEWNPPDTTRSAIA